MKQVIIVILLLLLPAVGSSQVRRVQNTADRLSSDSYDYNNENNRGQAGKRRGADKDKKKKGDDLPTGLHVWKADPRFGVVDSVEIDTMPHLFQNDNYTEGRYGQYNTLGNMGSPRLSRLFAQRKTDFSYFIFADPYDFFITPFEQLHFTNTKSPITNLTYHESMGSETGQDRIKALYAINMNKDIGFGLKLDYLYGRGHYQSQTTSNFNATLFGSILKDQYKAHFAFYANYLKTSENGGITDDDYIKNPSKFPSSYGTTDIPTQMDRVWNKMHYDGLQWTHRYSLGFKRKIEEPIDTTTAKAVVDTVKAETPQIEGPPLHERDIKKMSHLDSLMAATDSTKKEVAPKMEFIPVTSFMHTLKVQSNSRMFLANEELSNFYTNKYFENDSTKDQIDNMLVSNLVGVELHEGFNKWALAGIRLFGQHDFNQYKMPLTHYLQQSFTENRITLGAQLFKEKGRNITYHLEASTSSDGSSWGEFNLSGVGNLRVKLFGDSLQLKVYGNILNRKPTFFFRKYHSHYLRWDNSLDKQFTSHVGATLHSEATHTRLTFDLQNVKNYTYLANTANLLAGTSTTFYTMDTEVRQADDNIQLLSLRLNQDFRLGILNWENEVAYQTTTDKEVIPLPTLSLFSNLYLLFRIAKVLRVEFGGEVRYFTSYYAPTYSPAIGMFANQATENRIKIGNYPVVDVYANFHLKHTRFYIMASHVNYSKGSSGNCFLAPHYPINPFCVKLGLSWNFFN